MLVPTAKLIIIAQNVSTIDDTYRHILISISPLHWHCATFKLINLISANIGISKEAMSTVCKFWV